MEYHSGMSTIMKRRIRIRRPMIQTPEDEKLWEEVRRYARLVPDEANPNLGRVREIKEEIKEGTYLTPEIIEEAAARLAARFIKSE